VSELKRELEIKVRLGQAEGKLNFRHDVVGWTGESKTSGGKGEMTVPRGPDGEGGGKGKKDRRLRATCSKDRQSRTIRFKGPGLGEGGGKSTCVGA